MTEIQIYEKNYEVCDNTFAVNRVQRITEFSRSKTIRIISKQQYESIFITSDLLIAIQSTHSNEAFQLDVLQTNIDNA